VIHKLAGLQIRRICRIHSLSVEGEVNE